MGILTVKANGRVGILTVKANGRVGIRTDKPFLQRNSLGQPGDSHWHVHNISGRSDGSYSGQLLLIFYNCDICFWLQIYISFYVQKTKKVTRKLQPVINIIKNIHIVMTSDLDPQNVVCWHNKRSSHIGNTAWLSWSLYFQHDCSPFSNHNFTFWQSNLSNPSESPCNSINDNLS